MDNINELDDFLKKVEEIESVVKGLNSKDEHKVSDSLQRADLLINKDVEVVDGIVTKTVFSKSSIQKYEKGKEYTKQPIDSSGYAPRTEQEAFMKILEKDANERFERKKENNRVANEFKEKGNEQFKLKNYKKALEFYDEAMKVVKDNIAIYTNRAQTLILLGKYMEAINDCDWALRLDEKCTKAMIHRGRAFTSMKDYDSAIKQFQEAKLIDTKKNDLIDDYIKETERCRLRDTEENSAKAFLDDYKKDELLDLVQILNEKINKKDQNIIYYSGGLRTISSICTNDITKKTLFRTQDGFKLFVQHPTISKYFKMDSAHSLNHVELDFLISCYELLENVCSNCDENIRSMFSLSQFSENIMMILNQKVNTANQSFKLSVLNLIINLTENEFGLNQISKNFNLTNLIKTLILQVNSAEQESLQLKAKSIEIIQNIFLDKRLLASFKPSNIKEVVEELVKLLQLDKITEISLKQMIFTIIYKITLKSEFISVVITLDSVWIEVLKLKSFTECKKETIDVLLCLLINLCSKKTPQIETFCLEIIENCLKLTEIQLEYTLTLIGNLLQNVIDQREKLLALLDKKFIVDLVNFIKNNKSLHQSVKVLALCTSFQPSFRKQLVEIDKCLHFLYGLFENKKTSADHKLNEQIINNAILCITHCVDDHSNLAKNLTEYNIIMDLLYLISNASNMQLRKSSGILVAKLSSQNETHMNRMRELDGFSFLKDVKV